MRSVRVDRNGGDGAGAALAALLRSYPASFVAFAAICAAAARLSSWGVPNRVAVRRAVPVS
jgi:hypothetical protein